MITEQKESLALNRVLYAALLVGSILFAYLSGERMAYAMAVVLFVLPMCSFFITFTVLRFLKVVQDVPSHIVKGQQDSLVVNIKNKTPLHFSRVYCTFYTPPHVLGTIENVAFEVLPFNIAAQSVTVSALHIGRFDVGLHTVHVRDIIGLFWLRRKYKKRVALTVMPRVLHVQKMPLIMGLMAQASSRFDIKDEDYATISEVRQYLPGDSIKRVHWKLTAKRNEWLVKVFQANALNRVTVISDTRRLPMNERDRFKLEDQLIENAVALARFCLYKGMPVDFMASDGKKAQAHTLANFEMLYGAISAVSFKAQPELNVTAMLTHVLNEATGYVNAILIVTKLDIELYERIANANKKGHYAAVVYLAGKVPFKESERIYNLVALSGMPCLRMTLEEGFDAT